MHRSRSDGLLLRYSGPSFYKARALYRVTYLVGIFWLLLLHNRLLLVDLWLLLLLLGLDWLRLVCFHLLEMKFLDIEHLKSLTT